MGISIVKSNMSQSPNLIEVYRGASKEIELDIKKPGTDVDGNPIDEPFDLTGCTVYFSVRKEVTSPKVLIVKSSVLDTEITLSLPLTDGKATIILDYLDTKLMEPGKYVFDVWVKKSDGKRFPVVEPSEFVILPAVTFFE